MTEFNNNLEESSSWTRIKSAYILKQICEHLNPKKLLNFIKYNKKVQDRLNINNNDYLNEYLKIELEMELIPVENKCIKFINVHKHQRANFHFYFDDNPVENKNHYINKDEKVKKIKIIIDNEIKSFDRLFENSSCIKKIRFLKFNKKDIENMSNMFLGCSSLEEIDLSHFNTDNVTNMSYMFFGCSSLKGLNLSKFNTNNVTNMKFMFCECSSIKRLNLFNFNTNKVTTMRGMFDGCSSLEKIDLSNFDTHKVNNMCQMFRKCSSLKEINVSNFYTNEVENMCEMFKDCLSLKELNLSSFHSNNLMLMNFMFGGCTSLEKLNLSNFDSKNIFIVNCRLGQSYFSNILTNTVKPIKLMLNMCPFYGINNPGFNLFNIIGMTNIFDGCSSLKELNCEDELIQKEYRKFQLSQS